MSSRFLLAILPLLALAGCNRPVTPQAGVTSEAGVMPDRKPALSAPPPSMMTPQGY